MKQHYHLKNFVTCIALTFFSYSHLEAAVLWLGNTDESTRIQIDNLVLRDQLGNPDFKKVLLKASDDQSLHLGQKFTLMEILKTYPGLEDASFEIETKKLVISKLTQNSQINYQLSLELTNIEPIELIVAEMEKLPSQNSIENTEIVSPTSNNTTINATNQNSLIQDNNQTATFNGSGQSTTTINNNNVSLQLTTTESELSAVNGAPHTMGEKFGGGIVFYVTPDKKHGLIAANQDLTINVTWYEAKDAISNPDYYDNTGKAFTDWRVPTKRELTLLYQQKIHVPNLDKYAEYWSSIERNEYSAWSLYFNEYNNADEYYHPHKEWQLKVRSVRSF